MCSSRGAGRPLRAPLASLVPFHASNFPARYVVPLDASHVEKRGAPAHARLRTAVRQPDSDYAAARVVLGEREVAPQVADRVVDQPQPDPAPVSLL